MKKANMGEIKRGQTISFRIPSDIPDHLLKHLQVLKDTERRNFSSKMAEFVIQGLGTSFAKERETITIPLPHQLSKSQRNWIKHEHSEALLGSIVFHLLSDPVRSTALLASLNSNSLDINQALYLQEEPEAVEESSFISMEETAAAAEPPMDDDDLDGFEWDSSVQTIPPNEEENSDEPENELDSLLGDFLAKMNK